MIELTINDMLNSMEPLKKLSAYQLKTKIAYQIARLMREINKEYELFQKTRQNLAMKYAEKNEKNEIIIDENGNYKIKNDKINICNEEIAELINTKISLNVEPINLEDIENTECTPTEIFALMPLIQEKAPLE